jgi:hypothetical protein
MIKKVFNLINTIPHSVRLVDPYCIQHTPNSNEPSHSTVCLAHGSICPSPKKIKQSETTPAARGLEELFSVVLNGFLKPIHALHVYCKK